MSDRDFHLRDAGPDDAEAVAALLTELGHPTEAIDIPKRLSLVIAEGGAVKLAVDDDKTPLGLLVLSKHWGLHAPGPVAYIAALVVTNAARRRGVGKIFVVYAREWGKSLGCSRLTVTSAEHRADAHAFYPAMGMPYTGRRFSDVL
ncbi:MAG: GNAT family N-acetyltransferase [Gemmatimonadales bacterium]